MNVLPWRGIVSHAVPGEGRESDRLYPDIVLR